MRKGKIVHLFDRKRVDGDVGIEIEMEGTNLTGLHQHASLRHGVAYPWAFKMDGSLRGESCEWVLNSPIYKEEVPAKLAMLFDNREVVSATFTPSRRCGVHIHVNVQQMTEQAVFNFLCTYIAFEPVLVRWAGEDREGNLFCLRASDARELIDKLAQARVAGNLRNIMGDYIRYASVNINAIMRYGSVEFRALGTPTEPKKITQWVRMLYCVKELAAKFDDIRELLYALSAHDARDM